MSQEAKALNTDETETLETVASSEMEDGAGNTQDESAEGEEETVVTIGDAEPAPDEESKAPEWVRELRRNHREVVRKNKELEAKLHSLTAEPKPAELGKKPTLEDCDFDADRFETELTAWHEKKRAHDDAQAQAKKAEETAQSEWQAKLDGYQKSKAELKIKDFAEAEAEAQELFSVTQQGIIIQGADNPALVIYALGKNTKQAKDLSEIKDPVKFTFAVAKLEAQLKVTQRKQAPNPEKVVTGNGRPSGAVDSTLERLEAEAEKTGDRTKIIQFKASLRAKNHQ